VFKCNDVAAGCFGVQSRFLNLTVILDAWISSSSCSFLWRRFARAIFTAKPQNFQRFNRSPAAENVKYRNLHTIHNLCDNLFTERLQYEWNNPNRLTRK